MRDMENVSNEGAEKNGWKIVVPFQGELIGKAVYEKDGIKIMKSTKRLAVPGGWIYNTTTEVHDVNDNISVAEALCFVPCDPYGGAKETKAIDK